MTALPNTAYDPWANVDEIRRGEMPKVLHLAPSRPVPVLPPRSEVELRSALAEAQTDLDGARRGVHDAETALSAARASLDAGEARLDEARALDVQAEQAVVDLMHAAITAGRPIDDIESVPSEVAAIEKAVAPVRRLVERLQGELAERQAEAARADGAVSDIVADLMRIEAHAVAVELFRARQVEAALRARLDVFVALEPPNAAAARPPIAQDTGGAIIYRPDPRPLPSFGSTAASERAMFASVPGQTGVNTYTDRSHASWRAYAMALRTNAAAAIDPIPEPSETL